MDKEKIKLLISELIGTAECLGYSSASENLQDERQLTIGVENLMRQINEEIDK